MHRLARGYSEGEIDLIADYLAAGSEGSPMINRRQMMLAGLSAGAALYAPRAAAANKAKIAIIGAGYGGATAATSLARLLPTAEITLIAGEGDYFSCPFSNLLLTGEGDIASQTFTRDFGAYENLRACARLRQRRQ